MSDVDPTILNWHTRDVRGERLGSARSAAGEETHADERTAAPTVVGGYYQHQNGGYYRVEAIATYEPDLSEVVLYRSVQDGTLWVRPLCVFHGWKEGKLRFQHMPHYALTP